MEEKNVAKLRVTSVSKNLVQTIAVFDIARKVSLIDFWFLTSVS